MSNKWILSLTFLFLFFGIQTEAFYYQGKMDLHHTYDYQEKILFRGLSLTTEMIQIISEKQLIYLNSYIDIEGEEKEWWFDYGTRESFFFLSLEQVNLCLGKQYTPQGSAFAKNPTERFMPLDLRKKGFSENRMGIQAVRLDYLYGSQTTFTGILSFGLSAHLLPEGMVENILTKGLAKEPPQRILVHVTDPSFPRYFSNQYALILKQEGLILGGKLALSYFQGYERFPGITFHELERLPEKLRTGKPVILTYRETQGVGIDVATPLGDGLLYLELDYRLNSEEEKTLEMALGRTFFLGEETSSRVQYYYQMTKGALLETEKEEELLFFLKRPFLGRHTISLNTIWNIPKEELYLNPEMVISLPEERFLKIGGTLLGKVRNWEEPEIFGIYLGLSTHF